MTAEQRAQDIADTAKAEGFTLVSQTSQGFTLTRTVDPDASSRRIDLTAVAAPREGTQSVFLYLTLY